MPRILVVTNPRSRQNRRRPGVAASLQALVGDMGTLVAPETPEALREALLAARAEGVEVVAVNGGDGTTHVVLTAMVGVWGEALPRVALLRGGTMNTVASGVGVRGSPAAILGRLLATLRADQAPPTVTRSLLAVHGPTPQYGFLFGNGLIANFLEVYYEGAEPTPAKALWILARGIASSAVNGALIRRLMRPIRLEVEVGGARWPARDYLAVGAGTVDDIGFRFRPFYEAPDRPGHMHALGIACTPGQFVLQLPRIRLARPPSHPDIRSVVTDRLVLHGDRPISFMIDGDFHTGGEVLEVGVGPTVRLLVP